jgi:hypothetical protein
MEDADQSTSCLHHPAVMLPRGSATPKRAIIVRQGTTGSRVSPRATWVSKRWLHQGCREQGSGTEAAAIAGRDRSHSSIFTGSRIPQLDARTRCGIKRSARPSLLMTLSKCAKLGLQVQSIVARVISSCSALPYQKTELLCICAIPWISR